MAANHPLPHVWLLSDARNDADLERSLAALPPGSGFVYRHYHLPPGERRVRYDALRSKARALGHTVILAGTDAWPADGYYGSRPYGGAGLYLATAHDGDEIERAVTSGADGIFLSPVFATASHPGAPVLGAQGFHALAQRSPLPVIALGGMNAVRARQIDWPRWGAIDGLTAVSARAHTDGATD